MLPNQEKMNTFDWWKQNTHKQKNLIYLTKLTQLNPTRLNRRVNVSSYLNLFSHAAVCHWASRVKPLYQQAEGSLPRHHTAHPKAKHTIWTIPSTKRASINIFRLVENTERKGVWKSNVQRETENSRGSRVTLKSLVLFSSIDTKSRTNSARCSSTEAMTDTSWETRKKVLSVEFQAQFWCWHRYRKRIVPLKPLVMVAVQLKA